MLQAGNWTKNNARQVNSARLTVGELLSNFLSKIRFVFGSKTFPVKDSLTQKRSNVQDNNDVTKQSLSSTPPLKCTIILETFSSSHRLSSTFNLFTPFHGSERKISASVSFYMFSFNISLL